MRRFSPLYGLYERRLAAKLVDKPGPAHVGVILDGNRRWARSVGLEPVQGHQAGADRIEDLLTWCEEVGVGLVTLWMLSTDNLRRTPQEIADLLEIVATTVAKLARTRRWRLQMVGELDLLPPPVAERLHAAEEMTADVEGLHVNIAVPYGGRHEIAGAVRDLIRENTDPGSSIEDVLDLITVDNIADHLYTKGQPDPDLVIRTSGEQRLGGFLLWQSTHSEYYFCEAYWPDFRKVDFLRALRSYAERERRMGQ